MKTFFVVISLGCCMVTSAQFDFTGEQNLRTSFYDFGDNPTGKIKAGSISKEAAYDMVYNTGTVVDSALVYYAEYDSFGNILFSARYKGSEETIYTYSNTYAAGKLMKRFYTISINGKDAGSRLIQYNDAGQEEYFYVYQEKETEPTVYKKGYNNQGLVQYIWEADPFSKRFSALAKFDYLSNGDMTKVTKYPVYRKQYTVPEQILYYTKSRSNDISTEIVSNSFGQPLFSYMYDSGGRCISKERNMALTSFEGSNGVWMPPGHGNYHNIADGNAMTGVNNVFKYARDKEMSDNPFPANRLLSRPGQYLIGTTFTAKPVFNKDQTIDQVITRNENAAVTRVVKYYYNGEAVF